jgi:pimeloyl-ACP methyl ester carboxylesterase
LWHYRESGSGRPLILLHGIGLSHTTWDPVTPFLRPGRRVIAFDIAGFGRTPPLPGGLPPTVPHLVDAFARALRDVRADPPVDIAGNSLGGYMALEAARRGLARTVVAISPAGLWTRGAAPHVKWVFGALRYMARHFPNVSRMAMRAPWLRELALAIPIAAGSRRMPAADALRALDDLAGSPGFEETFEQTRTPFSGRGIAVPVTVAFGARDWILRRSSRRREALPPHTRWISKPHWGHVPMWIDPAGVAQLILDGTQ